MSKVRVYEYAKQHNMTSKELLEKAEKAGLHLKSHMSSLEAEDEKKLNDLLKKDQDKKKEVKKKQVEKEAKPQNKASKDSKVTSKNTTGQNRSMKKNKKNSPNSGSKNTKQQEQKVEPKKQKQNQKQNRRDKRNKNQNQQKNKLPNYNLRKKVTHNKNQQPKAPKELPTKIEYTEGMTVAELAKKMHRSPADIIKFLFGMGVMVTQNASLDSDAIELVLAEYGIDAEQKVIVDPSDFDHYFEDAENESEDKLETRPAVVTIMGHVDHGKTTLLDHLRNANVVEGEAGGITQHIGAYQVVEKGQSITFLDTPGHEAFTTMRARGADVTDIVVIVVAADDGVKPQTVEAINHAKAADVPIIVAINKIDKPAANPMRVKQELMAYELISEDMGGETIFVEISAKFGQNIKELLDQILTVAYVQELKADPNRNALGSVIEARLDPHKGSVATILVQYGTLNHGDAIVVGNTYGRVRTMTNDKGRRIKSAGPSTPVEITGLQSAPQAGDRFVVFEDEKTARQIGEARAMRAEQERRNNVQKVTLDNLFDTLQEGTLKTVNIVLKADVQGSVEAIKQSLQKIEVQGVKIEIIHAAAGAVNESDVSLAAASGALIIAFNVRPTPLAKQLAEQEEIEIRQHNIIYNVIEEVESAMKGQLDPEYEEEVTGEVVIRETYKVAKVGTIGGAYVTNGFIDRGSQIRLIRDGIVIHEGQLSSLRRFKDDVRRVTKGYECGLMIEDYNDIKENDVIEAYHMVEIKRK